jgi:hypothetical protein
VFIDGNCGVGRWLSNEVDWLGPWRRDDKIDDSIY